MRTPLLVVAEMPCLTPINASTILLPDGILMATSPLLIPAKLCPEWLRDARVRPEFRLLDAVLPRASLRSALFPATATATTMSMLAFSPHRLHAASTAIRPPSAKLEETHTNLLSSLTGSPNPFKSSNGSHAF